VKDTPYIEGPLYVGAATIPIQAMYLFNFEETAVVSAECLNCPMPKYDPGYSVKKKELNATWLEILEVYIVSLTQDQVIKAQCRGIRDKICIDYEFCSEAGDNDFDFLIVTKYLGNTQVGVFLEDGMVGLSPNPKTKVESFPEYLVRAKLIPKHTLHFNETSI